MADVRNTGTWQRVERGYNDMENLISRGEYNLALVKGRQTMEQIIRLCAARNFVIYTDLAETIDNLYRDGYISSESRDNCHTIRMLGNKAVHEGDNSSKDAGNAIRLLRREMSAFADGSGQREDRTPVMIKPEREAGRGAARRREPEERERPSGYRERERGREQGAEINLDMISQNLTPRGSQRRDSDRAHRGGSGHSGNGRRTGNSGGQRSQARRGSSGRNQRQQRQRGINIYDILRILIPVICIILLVILIRGLIPSGEENTTTAAPTTTEAVTTVAVTETEPPTTEATTAAPVRYMIKGNSVNARYEPSTSARIYEQLSDGTEIGEVEEVEGGDWVKFTRDGIELYVGSDYITPIE